MDGGCLFLLPSGYCLDDWLTSAPARRRIINYSAKKLAELTYAAEVFGREEEDLRSPTTQAIAKKVTIPIIEYRYILCREPEKIEFSTSMTDGRFEGNGLRIMVVTPGSIVFDIVYVPSI
jgi:hypothetical protein